jgi:catechol 2,3-dioxygenase-like lactoylglutathione lyase family enzyme
MGILFLAVAALAQQPPGRGAGAFERFDRNGDGKITRDELPGPLFAEIDRDGDGAVTREEARAYYATRRPARQAAAPTAAADPAVPGAPLASGGLDVVDAVFELCVVDVPTVTRFYRDGIGMREFEPVMADKGALLEWAGCFLRLRKVSAPTPPGPTGNPMKTMLATNGFRWFSLWFADPAAVVERVVAAGYPRPTRGANVSLTFDPEGNVVEIMGIPRSADRETFTWGMAVSDEAAARRFYGEVLGLREFEPWNLPPPFSLRMYLFATGAGRVKFAAPAGQRPRDSERGPGAPGLRSVTLRVADLATARDGLTRWGAKVEGETRLLVTDPDGNRVYLEQAPPGALAAPAVGARPGAGTPAAGRASPTATAGQAGRGRQPSLGQLLANAPPPTPHTEEVADQRPGEPPLKKMPDCDATRDAAGRGQMFESIVVPGFTGIREGTNGIAIADLNRDGRVDIVATYSAPRGSGGNWGVGEKLRVFINQGDFQFMEHPIKLLDSNVSPAEFGRGQVPVLADFNRDGFLDILVTRHAQMSGGESNPRDQKLGNGLYVTDGAWDVFRDVSQKMGIQNEKAYNRQPSFGDVNRDGWLDIAVGCDNIKNAMGGFPHSRLYVFQPKGDKFEEGTFKDIGGTELVPDFGGFYHDSAKDKAGPDINLRDLDHDGDLDLSQSFHVDISDPALPFSPVEYRQGVFCWKNLLAETGSLKFEKVTGNGLACEGRLKLSADRKSAEPVGKAPGLPYISLADVDNDGLLDVLAVGPATSFPGWAPRVEVVGGRFWRNLGDFRFEERTEAAGLNALTWTYQKWFEFFACPAAGRRMDGRPYFADAIFGDFDNDGWVDVVVQDRSERAGEPARAMLFMNKGDGTFELKPTTFSGLDGNGICGEAADLNNDGLLDLVFAADPDNTGLAADALRYEDKVYWNTGLHGARANHWLRLRFSGVSDAELIGVRVEVFSALNPEPRTLPPARVRLGTRWVHPNHSYKSGGALEAHFGLGKVSTVDLKVTLPAGRAVTVAAVQADRFLDVDLKSSSATPVSPARQP